MNGPSTSVPPYVVLVRSNSRYQDEDEEYRLGEFDGCQSAISACKKIVDDFLSAHFSPGMTYDALYKQYTTFGEDPFIVSSDSECSFSAWNYAKKRCIELVERAPIEQKVQDVKKRIWKIRDSIQELEDSKDNIIEYLNSCETIDESTKNMWAGDVKAVYFTIVMVWEMVYHAPEKVQADPKSTKGLLDEAGSRYDQTVSELRSFEDEQARLLVQRLRSAFDRCWGSLSTEIKRLMPRVEVLKPDKPVYKISETEYRLPCSVCSNISAVFKIGVPFYEKKEALLYEGTCHSLGIDLEYAHQIFEWLKQENIWAVHNFFRSEKYLEKDHRMEDGLDAYCPDCNAIYCREDYKAREEWDQGFYDCTWGTCPQGHTRVIDD